MKVILHQDVPNLGQTGDVVDVKAGYARNYLIPNSLAALATPGNLEHARALAKRRQLRRQKEIADFQQMAGLLAGKSVVITAKVNEAGHLYGSVGQREIAQAFNDLYNTAVAAAHVQMSEHIKEPCGREVLLRFADGVEARVTVEVLAEGAAAPQEPSEG